MDLITDLGMDLTTDLGMGTKVLIFHKLKKEYAAINSLHILFAFLDINVYNSGVHNIEHKEGGMNLWIQLNIV